MAATNAAVEALVLNQGTDLLRWWVPTEEPKVAYASCSQCGSSLFWRSKDRPSTQSIAAGTLDPPTGVETVHALFVAEASDYHTLDPSLSSHPHDSNGPQ